MFYRLGVSLAFVALAFFANPLAMLACEPDTVARECADSIPESDTSSKCGDSGCQDDAAPCACALCGKLGKIFAALISNGGPIRMEAPLTFFTCEQVLTEGFSPSIDQPPRMA